MKLFLNEKCTVCGKTDINKLFSVGDFDNTGTNYDLFKCRTCGLVQILPLPNENELDKYYKTAYYGSGQRKFITIIEKLVKLANKSRALHIDKYLRSLKRTMSNHGRKKILDVGCGRGLLLKAFKKLGYDCSGVERGEFVCDEDNKNEITIFKKDLKSIGFESGSKDVIVLWHVLEHILKPVEIIEELTRILSPEGLFVLSVPNIDSFQSRLFKNHWFHLDVPRHPYHFSLKPLNMILTENNYTIIYKSTFSIEQSIFGFIQSFFNKFIVCSPQNSFYFLLKKDKKTVYSYMKLCFWLVLSLFVLPFALIECLISSIMKKGAVLTIYAKKNDTLTTN